MEKKLSTLFDFQKFAGNRKLQKVIDSVSKRPRVLTLKESGLISAAGSPYYKPSAPGDEVKDRHP